MLGAPIKHFIRDLLDIPRRAETWLQELGAERRCAVRLDTVADRLGVMGAKINMLRSRMDEGSMDEAVDADFQLRDALKELKEDIRGIRCQLAGMQAPQLGARLQRAFARLNKVAAETYSSADRLQWEIGEHDRHFVR